MHLMACTTAKQGGFGVSLDGKMVRTPARAVLVAPTHALAVAIAAEWEYQEKTLIRPFTMPLMALTSTAIDQVGLCMCMPPHCTVRQPRKPAETIETLLRLALTDSMCVRYETGPVADKQEEVRPVACETNYQRHPGV